MANSADPDEGILSQVYFSPKNAHRIANSVEPDQSSLIYVYTVCSGLSVGKLKSREAPSKNATE